VDEGRVNKGILQYWQTLFGIISFVFAAGVIYGEFKSMKKDQVNSELVNKQRYDELQARYQRQFELINKLNDRIIELEKDAAYDSGLHQSEREK
jgi:hypothetical protein